VPPTYATDYVSVVVFCSTPRMAEGAKAALANFTFFKLPSATGATNPVQVTPPNIIKISTSPTMSNYAVEQVLALRWDVAFISAMEDTLRGALESIPGVGAGDTAFASVKEIPPGWGLGSIGAAAATPVACSTVGCTVGKRRRRLLRGLRAVVDDAAARLGVFGGGEIGEEEGGEREEGGWGGGGQGGGVGGGGAGSGAGAGPVFSRRRLLQQGTLAAESIQITAHSAEAARVVLDIAEGFAASTIGVNNLAPPGGGPGAVAASPVILIETDALAGSYGALQHAQSIAGKLRDFDLSGSLRAQGGGAVHAPASS
jgi:hypothetical protein